MVDLSVSGYQDLNLGPPAPKAGALPDCATSRILCGCEFECVCDDLASQIFFSAVREGFEPSVHVSTYDGLANRWFQPLTHLTLKLYCYESGN